MATATAYDNAPPRSARAAFGERLRAMRLERQLTQQALGTALYFSRESVAMIERGLRTPTAVFVQRAGVVLQDGGELQRLFDQIEQDRDTAAQHRPPTRRPSRRTSRLGVVVGRLRAAIDDPGSSDEPSSPVWVTLDQLHRALREELQIVDVDSNLVELERRLVELRDCLPQRGGQAEVAHSAALGVAQAVELLAGPLRSDQIVRLVAVAAQLATVAGAAFSTLGDGRRSAQWHSIANAITARPSPLAGGTDHDEDAVESTQGGPSSNDQAATSGLPTPRPARQTHESYVASAKRTPRRRAGRAEHGWQRRIIDCRRLPNRYVGAGRAPPRAHKHCSIKDARPRGDADAIAQDVRRYNMRAPVVYHASLFCTRPRSAGINAIKDGRGIRDVSQLLVADGDGRPPQP